MGQMEARNVVDYATLTVSSTAVDLTDASPAINAGTTVRRAIITLDNGGSIRWRADGTAPTSSEGHLMNPGDSLQFLDASYRTFLRKIQFIRTTSSDGNLKITYFD